MKTAEEILTEYTLILEGEVCTKAEVIIGAMECYANQYRSLPIEQEQRGLYVMYAKGWYEVADFSNEFGVQWVHIYDEPPSRHIDRVKLSSTEGIKFESSPIEQPEAQNYICLHCKEIFPYEPVMCNECGCKTFHKTEAKQPEAPQQHEIIFGVHLKCIVKLTGDTISVEKAVNGWGDVIPDEEIKITCNPL